MVISEFAVTHLSESHDNLWVAVRLFQEDVIRQFRSVRPIIGRVVFTLDVEGRRILGGIDDDDVDFAVFVYIGADFRFF